MGNRPAIGGGETIASQVRSHLLNVMTISPSLNRP